MKESPNKKTTSKHQKNQEENNQPRKKANKKSGKERTFFELQKEEKVYKVRQKAEKRRFLSAFLLQKEI